MSNKKEKIKIVFFGTSAFGLPALAALLKDERFDIMAIVTQPDKKSGRKQALTPPPVKIFSLKHKLLFFQPEKIKTWRPRNINFDVAVVIAYGQKIPEAMLNIPPYGFINLHASLLPKYRGAACIQAPILNGDESSGLTIMKIDSGLDTGPILKQAEIKIGRRETAGTLHDKLAALGASILPDTLYAYVNGKIKPRPQDNRRASYVPQLKKEDGEINWHREAAEIERLVRALNPWPGAYFKIKDKKTKNRQAGLTIKILEAQTQPAPVNAHEPGRLFLYKHQLAVQCGRDALIINKLQPAGKKALTAAEFINGYRDLIN